MKTTNRLESLDTLRGFDFFWILLPTYPIFHFLLVAMGYGGCWLDKQMDHLPWNGFTFYDTIYPLFLFLAGVSFPFSYASSKRKGYSDWRVMLKSVKRMVVLVLVGSTIFGSLQLNPKTFTLTSVIGRIGIATMIATFIYLVGRKWSIRALLGAALFLVAWFLPFIIQVPGVSADVQPYSAPEYCIYNWVDGAIFKKPLFYFGGFAGMIAMPVTALLGMATGEWLRNENVNGNRKTLGLLVGAAVMLIAGMLVAHGFGFYSVPLNKPIWSVSYLLVSAAYSLAMLALFYWVIDVKNCRGWITPFKAIGMNALFTYMASRILMPMSRAEFFFGGLASYMPTKEWAEFVTITGYSLLYWFIIYYLYRKQVFIKA